eukprot:CAMPEP_0174737698 /NCGR_PEP_ID=MMETSP1094-20130205/68734_1 /TAXON_ID=156173 /ORGANISM="Chrysochromulina brevifilum, Strain UTEX LB 985" /LENGTH=73 /DNA_ID=CAMNT_0015940967 /DNA_START=373 /DNA_END=591 /DNA_ORIENTATION=+
MAAARRHTLKKHPGAVSIGRVSIAAVSRATIHHFACCKAIASPLLMPSLPPPAAQPASLSAGQLEHPKYHDML